MWLFKPVVAETDPFYPLCSKYQPQKHMYAFWAMFIDGKSPRQTVPFVLHKM
jgi:hypothetical protein